MYKSATNVPKLTMNEAWCPDPWYVYQTQLVYGIKHTDCIKCAENDQEWS